MRPILIDPKEPPSAAEIEGAVICEEVRIGDKRAFRKGHRVSECDLGRLMECDHPIPAMMLEAGDVHEDDAAVRIAQFVTGEGLEPHGPIQSRVNLKSTQKGLLRVDQKLLYELNHLGDPSVFSLIDRMAVAPGKTVASIKITPIATTELILAQAEQIAKQGPVVEVKSFEPLNIGVVTTEGMDEKATRRFRDSVLAKVGWYGASVSTFDEVDDNPEAVANAFHKLQAEGVDLIMSGGGNTINPFDPAMLALKEIGADIVRSGVPAHPGSMFWLAYLKETPIFNLASCSMYSKSTVADLVLPWLMAGERVTTSDMDAIGYGGLLDRDMKFRFPPYDAPVQESDTDD